MNDLLTDYYKAKLNLELLTLQVKEKQEAVMAFLKSQPDNKAAIPQAKFTIRKTPVYGGFSMNIADLETEVKDKQETIKRMKKEEIENGVAKVVDEMVVVQMTKISK